MQSRLQAVLASIAAGQPAAGGGATDVSLTQVLTAEALATLLTDPAASEALLPHLPPGLQTPEELRGTARQPHFVQALRTLNEAVRSGALGPVLTQFGIPPAEAARISTVEGLLEAFARHYQPPSA
jgi:hypothetical protein